MDSWIELGKVAGVHGIHGALLLSLYTESRDVFGKGGEIRLDDPDGQSRTYKIESSGPHKGKQLVRLKGVDSRSQAESLKGRPVFVEKSRLPQCEEGEYYWFELIGLEVFEGNGARLGILESIIETGSNDVYVVKDGSRETLVPALSRVLVSVDVDAGKMVVDLPEGL